MMGKKLILLLGVMLVAGCSLDEVTDRGGKCKKGDEPAKLSYILDGENRCNRDELTCYLDAFKLGVCPKPEQECYVDKAGEYYCMRACQSGWLACDNKCIDPDTSLDFCGAKGNCYDEDERNSRGEACGAGATCNHGKCEGQAQVDCGENQKKCPIGTENKLQCANIQSDRDNCGDCGVVCDANEQCIQGTCKETPCDKACYLGNQCVNLHEMCGIGCVNCAELDGAENNKTSCNKEIGKCSVKECRDGYHIAENEDGEFCEANSDEKCGARDSREVINCLESAGEHAVSFTCGESGTCTDLTCEQGYEPLDNVCVGVTVQDCNGQNCSEIEHWVDGTCENMACKATSCEEGFFVANGGCSPDSASSCGASKVDCGEALEHEVLMDCVNGQCVALSCEVGYHAADGKCVTDSNSACGATALACPANSVCTSGECKCSLGYHAYQNACEKDNDAHCGSHENACEDYAECRNQKCECKSGYHSTSKGCEKDSVHACGPDSIDCEALKNSQYLNGLTFANTVDCQNSRCVAVSCQFGGEQCNGECSPTGWGEGKYISVENCGGCSSHKESFECTGGQVCGVSSLGYFFFDANCECPDGYYSDSVTRRCEKNAAEHCGAMSKTCSGNKPYCREKYVIGWLSSTRKWDCSACDVGTHEKSSSSTTCVADDIDNCGDVGNRCNRRGVVNTTCVSGHCVDTECSTGYTLCGNECVDLLNDNANCGWCGVTCSRNTDMICIAGRCSPNN